MAIPATAPFASALPPGSARAVDVGAPARLDVALDASVETGVEPELILEVPVIGTGAGTEVEFPPGAPVTPRTPVSSGWVVVVAVEYD